jgi:hypothetical protein
VLLPEVDRGTSEEKCGGASGTGHNLVHECGHLAEQFQADRPAADDHEREQLAFALQLF